MTDDQDKFDRLLDAIADSQEIPWSSAHHESADAEEARIVRNLSFLARIADANQQVMAESPGLPFATWGHLQLIERIGAGGYGEVFRAREGALDREVALKLFRPHNEPPSSEAARKRMDRQVHEAKLLATLRHENLVRVHGIEVHRGRIGFWMELIQGKNLDELLEGHGPMDATEASIIGIKISRALGALHAKGILHRDLKAANVMREVGGHLYLVDLGTGTDAQNAIQRDGTPLYLAPEALLDGRSSKASDIYSLGVLLFYCVTRRFPVEGDIEDLRSAHREHRRSSLADLRPDLPAVFRRVVGRCLEANPAKRFKTAFEVADALESVSGGKKDRRRLVNTALVAIIVAVVASQAISLIARRHSRVASPELDAAAQPGGWILVSEFDGPPGDPALALAARELIVSALAGSRIVVPIPAAELKDGLRLASKPDSTRVTGAVARELAVRASARTYVEGRVLAASNGYVVTVTLHDADSDRVVMSVSATPASERDFLPAIGRLGKQLVKSLGWKPQSFLSGYRTPAVSTQSLVAYKAYAAGMQRDNEGNAAGARYYFRQAVLFDPKFAAAWMGISVSYWTQQLVDSVAVGVDQALAYRDRLSEKDQVLLDAWVALQVQEDCGRALESLRGVVASSPRDARILNSYYVALGKCGRGVGDECVQILEMAIAASPFGPTPKLLSNYFTALCCVGRLDEARGLIASLPPRRRAVAEFRMAMLDADWVSADSLAMEIIQDPVRYPQNLRESLELSSAAILVARGAVVAGINRFEELSRRASEPYLPLVGMRLAQSAAGQAVECSIDVPEGLPVTALIEIGAQAGFCRDSASLSRVRGILTSRPLNECARFVPDLKILEAQQAACEGKWREAEELLSDFQPSWLGALPARWVAAQSAEKYRSAAEAAVRFEHVLKVAGSDPTDAEISRPVLYAFTFHRLVMLHSSSGNYAEARRCLDALQETWTRPDSLATTMLRQAQQAVASMHSQTHIATGASGGQ